MRFFLLGWETFTPFSLFPAGAASDDMADASLSTRPVNVATDAQLPGRPRRASFGGHFLYSAHWLGPIPNMTPALVTGHTGASLDLTCP